MRVKNYKLRYIIALVLFIAGAFVHATGYLTNAFFVLAWTLWMPVIAVFVVALFDLKNCDKAIRKKIFAEENYKTPYFVILVITVLYVIFNLVYNFNIINGVSDILSENGVYYMVDKAGVQLEIEYSTYVKYALASYRLLSGHMLALIVAPVWYYKIRWNIDEEANIKNTREHIKNNTKGVNN